MSPTARRLTARRSARNHLTSSARSEWWKQTPSRASRALSNASGLQATISSKQSFMVEVAQQLRMIPVGGLEVEFHVLHGLPSVWARVEEGVPAVDAHDHGLVVSPLACVSPSHPGGTKR